MRTAQVETCANKGGAAQGSEDTSLAWRLACDGSADGGPETPGVGSLFGQPAGQRADEVAIGIEAQHLETGHAAFCQPRAIVLQGALLRAFGHVASPLLS